MNNFQGVPVTYDPSLQQNGVSLNVGTPISVPYTRFGAPQVGGYAMPSSPWVSGYMMTQPMAPVDEQVNSQLNNYVRIGIDLFYTIFYEF